MDAVKENIHPLLQKYIKREDNLFYCEKLFKAISFLNWIEKNSKDLNQRIAYKKEIFRFLDGEIDLYWEKGSIKIKKLRKS
jgi:hypothetical protein